MSLNPLVVASGMEMKPQNAVYNTSKDAAVIMRTTIYDIYDIDPVKQTFNAELGLHMVWHSEGIEKIAHTFVEDYFELEADELPNSQYRDKIFIPSIYLGDTN